MNDRLVGSIAIVCSIGGSLYCLFKAPMTKTKGEQKSHLKRLYFVVSCYLAGAPFLPLSVTAPWPASRMMRPLVISRPKPSLWAKA